MIKFLNISNLKPYKLLRQKYEEAISANQKSIEAIYISSFNSDIRQVNSRLVNLKFIDNDKFIFFTNYLSPKSLEFESHSQISAVLFWQAINSQIRFKANINKTSEEFNNEYFKKRSIDKNALAISSNQSQSIVSYDEVLKKYKKVKENSDLSICPKHWGGFYFKPFEIEFWEGRNARLNKRDIYKLQNNIWNHEILQP